MSNIIRIGDVPIHQDENSLYCLNDLHRAAGGENRHRPSLWLKNNQTKSLIFELVQAGITAYRVAGNAGIFARKELVYAYGMWISPQFYLHVVQIYDAVVTVEHEKLEAAQKRLKRAIVKDTNCVSSVFGQKDNSMTHKMFVAMEQLGLISIVTELKPSYRKEVTPAGYVYLSGCSKDGVVRVRPEKHRELVDLVRQVH